MIDRGTRTAIALAVVWLCSGTARAQNGALGSEFQVNAIPNSQSYPDVAQAANGTFVVVWVSSLDDGSVFARRYDSDGQAVGTEFQVNTYTTDFQGRASVAAAADGSFVVTWSSQGEDGSDLGVFGQRYDGAGQAVGTEFQVNTYTTNSQNYPTVATTAAGAFVVAWNSEDADAYGVSAQRFDSAGQMVGTEFQVNTYTTGPQYIPTAAMAADGAFVVAWMSQPPQDGSDQGVFAQRYNSSGGAAGTEFRVNSYTIGDQFQPSIAAADNGAFVVVWSSDNQDGSDFGVFGRRFDSAGQPAGTEFQVNNQTTDTQGYPPAVAASADGAFVVVWRSDEQDGEGHGIFARRYNSAGQPSASEFQVNTYTTSDQYEAEVAMGPDGSFVVVWMGMGTPDADGISAQRFGPLEGCGNGTADPGEECDDGNAENGDGCDSNCTTTACGNGITTLGEACDDGNTMNGDGCSSTCQDSAVPENVGDTELTGGETISSDGESDGATEADPVETSITMSVGTASVTIAEASGGPAIPGYSLIGQQVQIDFSCPGSPCPSSTSPLTIEFRIDASRIPDGIDETNLAVLRDGAAVSACGGGPGVASPDPCVSNRQSFGDGDIGVTILTSQASLWSFASTTCSPTPLTCAVPGKAVFLVAKASGDPSATKLAWKWLKGTIASASVFGDPLAGTSFAMCVYDGSILVQSHVVAPGGNCGSKPCWKVLGTKGFGYKNSAGNTDGITKVLLKSGTGNGKILVKGASVTLPDADPIYAQSPSVIVQLVNSSGTCWDAAYPSGAKKSSAQQFKDIIP